MKIQYTALICLYFLAACTPKFLTPSPETFEFKVTKKAFISSDGTELPLQVWSPYRPPRAVILALHGFNDYRYFFDTPANFLALHSIISYAYDQRGFGASRNPGTWAGVTTYTRDAAAAIRAIKRRHPNLPLYLLGSSMGGAVAILATSEAEKLPVEGLILAAPAIWGRINMPWYQRLALWIGAHVFPGITLTGRGLNITPSDNEQMLIRLNQDPMVIKETRIDTIYGLVNLMDAALAAAPDIKTPALVLYGQKDEVIPKKPTTHMLRALPKGLHRIALYSDGYHMLLRDLQAITVWKDIVAWVNDRYTPLPSKADQSSLKTLGIVR